ncbi:MAG: methylmalonyl-CoA epimerase, partial [Deltaproteobacteria bacterium]|nr:methylmalonyl-CoA epimerase [Deltaproteobacteria bacterium]
MIKKLRHIGIMVEDFERAVKKFEGFGLPLSEEMEKKEDGMKI